MIVLKIILIINLSIILLFFINKLIFFIIKKLNKNNYGVIVSIIKTNLEFNDDCLIAKYQLIIRTLEHKLIYGAVYTDDILRKNDTVFFKKKNEDLHFSYIKKI